MKQIAARRRKDNDKLKAQLIEILAQQRNRKTVYAKQILRLKLYRAPDPTKYFCQRYYGQASERSPSSAYGTYHQRYLDQNQLFSSQENSEQDTIISKLEHLLGRADVQPDNGIFFFPSFVLFILLLAFKAQIDELYHLTQQRQRFV